MEKLIVIGAGGHSKSVVDSIDPKKMKLCGFVDENKTGSHLGKPIYSADITRIPDYQSYKYFIAIGDVQARTLWYTRLQALSLELVNIIDATAVVSSTATMGVGNFVGKMAVINADAHIGNNNVINTKALVEHECKVGNHTHLSTNSVINGNVVVEDGVFLGSSSVCIGQLTVGGYAVVGAGSVVIRDVPANATVVGVPARVIKRNMNE